MGEGAGKPCCTGTRRIMTNEKMEAEIEKHLTQKLTENLSSEEIELLRAKVETIRQLSD